MTGARARCSRSSLWPISPGGSAVSSTSCFDSSIRSRASPRWWSCGPPSTSPTAWRTTCGRSEPASSRSRRTASACSSTERSCSNASSTLTGRSTSCRLLTTCSSASATHCRMRTTRPLSANHDPETRPPERANGVPSGDSGNARSLRPASCSIAGIGVDIIRRRLSEIGTIVEASPIVLPDASISFTFMVEVDASVDFEAALQADPVTVEIAGARQPAEDQAPAAPTLDLEGGSRERCAVTRRPGRSGPARRVDAASWRPRHQPGAPARLVVTNRTLRAGGGMA